MGARGQCRRCLGREQHRLKGEREEVEEEVVEEGETRREGLVVAGVS